MSSRKQQREEARAKRLAEEQARAEHERRRRRLRMLGGIAVGAVAVVAVLIAISSNKSTPSVPTGAAAKQTAASVEAMLSGIPQSGARLGNPNAPVTLYYYGDLQCPVCKDFSVSSLPQLIANEVRAGKVQVIYRSLQTATQDPVTFATQQVAALAAGQQQKFWNYTELFYKQQGTEGTGYVTGTYLDGLARQIPGLNLSTWTTARSNPTLAAQVQSDQAQSASQGFNSTPTLVFQGPKGKVQPPDAVPPYSELQAAIKQVA